MASAGGRTLNRRPLRQRLALIAGVLRSLAIYWRPGRQRRLQTFYRPFVPTGGLVFDVGAHVGDRTRAFSSLGARVVAIEPQPHLLPWLRFLVGRTEGVDVVGKAVGAEPGTTVLQISRLNPTVSSASRSWRGEVGRQAGFRGVRWEEEVRVPVTTLDQLVASHGMPDFCKIDVEGFEAQVLAGLTHPLPALSLEFISAVPGGTLAALARLESLGAYRLNASEGESQRLHFPEWKTVDGIRDWLAQGADGIPSGDLYARLSSP